MFTSKEMNASHSWTKDLLFIAAERSGKRWALAVKASIQEIFDQHKGRYGYRRITIVLRKSGTLVNHKTVRRLMGQMQTKSCLRGRKFRLFRGEVNRVSPNLLQRKFAAKRPNEKWATDVTEFNISGRKLYLSPVLDLYNGEIVSYEIARRPHFDMVGTMLRKAFGRLKPKDRPVLHSDSKNAGTRCFRPVTVRNKGLSGEVWCRRAFRAT